MSSGSEVIELLRALGLAGVTLLALVGAFYLIKDFFPAVEMLIGRLFRFLGWASKWVRRTSISSEIQGSINQVIHGLNSEFEHSLFPGCELRWVTADNKETLVEFGKAIVRVNFSRDRDVNTFAAAQAYTKAAVLPKTKPFLSKAVAKAIDLVLVKSIILAAKRSALTVFNVHFKDEDRTTKDTFFKLEDVNSKGLFNRILLQELHYFGELLGEKSPSEEYEHQAEAFVEWLYNLSTREHEEKSLLKFERSDLKVGVILVGREETLKEKGIEPYLRWAGFYASKDFHLVYLLSRGRMRGRVVKDISKILADTGAFEPLTKRPDYVAKDPFGEDITVTCIALRPNLTRLLQIGWEKLQEHFNASQEMSVIVNEVHGDGLIVDAYGLRIPIHASKLSALEISEISNFFRPGMELVVRIESIVRGINEVVLSNANTGTDPKKIIDLNLSLTDSIDAVVQHVRIHEGFEVGVEIHLSKLRADGFMPRSRATHSRFVSLVERFKKDSVIRVKLLDYQFRFGNYVCELADLKDPWQNITKYEEGSNVQATVREVAERYLNVEIEEGLEGRIYFDEISWASDEENLKSIKEYTPGSVCEAQVTRIDSVHRSISLSVKRCTECPAEKYIVTNHNRLVPATVSKVLPYGAKLQLGGVDLSGFVPISEVTWMYCDDIHKFLMEGDQIQVVVVGYNEHFNNINCSMKRAEENDAAGFLAAAKLGDVVLGSVREYVGDRYRVAIDLPSGRKAQGYVHRSELSFFLNGFISAEDFGSE